MYDIEKTFRAYSVAEALRLLDENSGAVLVNGGTDVMIRLKERKLRTATLISILDVQELKGICMEENGDIVIGPGTCFDDIYHNPLIKEHIPMLADACNQVGSPQIRHIATIGGNLCNGAVSADSVPALLSLNTLLEITSLNGVRIVPACNFHTGPGKTVLHAENEILTGIRIPKNSYVGHGGCYIKFGQRNAMEISTLSCAVNASVAKDCTIAEFAIAFGVAAPTPIRCLNAEAMMRGEKPTEELLGRLGSAVLEETSPRESWRASLELRRQLIRELSQRAARQAIWNAGGIFHD